MYFGLRGTTDQDTGKDCIKRGFMICNPYKYSDDVIKNDDLGGACDTFGEEERCTLGFCGET